MLTYDELTTLIVEEERRWRQEIIDSTPILKKWGGDNLIWEMLTPFYEFSWYAEPTTKYLYLMKIDLGLYKIGFSNNPSNRRKHLQAELGYPIFLLCELKVPNYSHQILERMLKDRFAQKNIFGEWFRLDNDDVFFIRSFFLEFSEEFD